MSSALETVYRLSVVGTRECYIGRTTLPLSKRLALHMLDDGGKARFMWMQKARLAGQSFEIAVLAQTAADRGQEAENRQIEAHRKAGWIVVNERRAHRRDEQKSFLRFAMRVLHDVYGIPLERMVIRANPFRKQAPHRPWWLMVKLEDYDFILGNKSDLRDLIAVLHGADYKTLWGHGRPVHDAETSAVRTCARIPEEQEQVQGH